MNTKYVQKNRMVGVRFDEATIRAIEEFAQEKRWSLASTVAWCVEQQLNITPCRTMGRR